MSSTSKSNNVPTVTLHPTIVSIPDSTTDNDNLKYECTAFRNEYEYDKYVDLVSPSRELVCPITQEVLQDPVVAEDGHTYERSALMRWFSMGRVRSPVTNSIMSGKKVYPNLAVQGMSQAHREKLGIELLERCKKIALDKGKCLDNGSRIAALLDAGADTTLRDHVSGNTPILMLIQAQNLLLVRTILEHDSSSVIICNNDNLSCVECIEDNIRRLEANYSFKNDTQINNNSIHEWRSLLENVRKKNVIEKAKIDERDIARSRANEEHREQQRTLGADLQTNNDNNQINGNNGRGLGQLEEGWGYFPSLVALQFQSSIPPPPASFAEIERRQKQKIQFIINIAGLFTLLLLLWC